MKLAHLLEHTLASHLFYEDLLMEVRDLVLPIVQESVRSSFSSNVKTVPETKPILLTYSFPYHVADNDFYGTDKRRPDRHALEQMKELISKDRTSKINFTLGLKSVCEGNLPDALWTRRYTEVAINMIEKRISSVVNVWTKRSKMSLYDLHDDPEQLHGFDPDKKPTFNVGTQVDLWLTAEDLNNYTKGKPLVKLLNVR